MYVAFLGRVRRGASDVGGVRGSISARYRIYWRYEVPPPDLECGTATTALHIMIVATPIFRHEFQNLIYQICS